MKYNFLLLGAAAVTMLSACQSEEIVEPAAQQGNEISFGVSTELLSRSAMVETSGSYAFESFNVSAGVSGTNTNYINDDEYLKKGRENTWIINPDDQPHSWPSYPLDFYAYTNIDKGTFNWNSGSPQIVFEVPEDATKQHDLLVAYAPNATKPANDTRLGLEFRHALSQVVFAAKNTSSNLKIVIDGVSMVKIASTGTFNYKNAFDTDGKLTSNSWTNRGNEKTFSTSFAPVNFPPKASTANLTDGSGEKDNVLLMIPQDLSITENLLDGFYFIISCRIYNVSEIDGSESLVYGNVGEDGSVTSKNVLIAPKENLTWLPGVKYAYTFNFNGSAGYDPDGKPVLTNIEFTISVDDFTEDTKEIEAGTSAQTNS